MVNKKAEGTYEETLNKSEAFFMKHGKTAIIAIVAILVVVAGFFLYKTFVSEPKETEASSSTKLSRYSKRYKAIIAALTLAISLIFTLVFAMHTKKNQTGLRL